jgi:hypothetical protein
MVCPIYDIKCEARYGTEELKLEDKTSDVLKCSPVAIDGCHSKWACRSNGTILGL